jgi:hypothetical protein
MASKTVVCPECGSAAAPGRYACSECGALLASVALSARGRGSAPRPKSKDGIVDDLAEPEIATAVDEPLAVASTDPDVDGLGAAESSLLASPATDSVDDPHDNDDSLPGAAPVDPASEPAPAGPTGDIAPAEPPSGPPADSAQAAPFDENAPLEAASRLAPQPDVLHDVAEPDDLDEEPTSPGAPSWPPPGDRGVLTAPEPRTPAGTYLPPSAVLPPLDAPLGLPSVRAAAAAASPAVSTGTIAGASSTGAPSSGSDATATSWTTRGRAGLNDFLGPAHFATSASRRAIAMGAGLASLGLLLPWVNTLPGGNPFANYFDRWGLVGPGGWIPLVALVGLLAVAAGWGRVMSWPLGIPAVAAAAFLAGLLFRYVFGGFGWAIGIWFTVVGAIVLVVGGLMDRSARHEPGDERV